MFNVVRASVTHAGNCLSARFPALWLAVEWYYANDPAHFLGDQSEQTVPLPWQKYGVGTVLIPGQVAGQVPGQVSGHDGSN